MPDAPSRKIIVTVVDSRYNRVTFTWDEIRLKLSKDSSESMCSRLFLACRRVISLPSIQTLRGQISYDREDATSMQIYTCRRNKAFKLYF